MHCPSRVPRRPRQSAWALPARAGSRPGAARPPTAAALWFVRWVAGCAPPPGAPEPPEPPQQTLDAIKADYRTGHRIAAAYQHDCAQRTAERKLGCDRHAAELQHIDLDLVFPAFAKVAAALKGGDSAHLSVSIEALRKAVRELTDYMSRNGIG